MPWVYSFDKEIINFDLERIKQAGFNTIRTWGALREEELQLVEASGLKIIFGIWIDPHGNYGNPSFINNSLNHVEDVLDYTQNYSCVIGYLIMNEPIISDIEYGGAGNLSNLWNNIIDIIHSNHPGIPVSFSNSIVGDFIDMSRFDFSAYNAYIYNPKLFTDSHGYSNYLKFLKLNRSKDKPMIITEFGLSVSPDYYSEDYSYGGNSLEQQTTGNLKMYRDLIDAGLQGGCVFQYHDGWWKAGDENIHDETAEEWFGLIGFSNINDRFGSPRPAWQAISTYNKAIITEPKNGEAYSNSIPIEIFAESDVNKYTVSLRDSVIFSGNISASHYNSEIQFKTDNNLEDLPLTFNFFDEDNELVKTESIIILMKKENVNLPKFNIVVLPGELIPETPNTISMKLEMDSSFQLTSNEVKYVMFPHVGWDGGTANSEVVNIAYGNWSFSDSFTPPAQTKVVTYGAGIGIRFGEWETRLSDQLILVENDWASSIRAGDINTSTEIRAESVKNNFRLLQNYPNPFNSETIIKYEIPYSSSVQIILFDALGQRIKTIVSTYHKPGKYFIKFNGNNLSSGVYFYQIQAGDFVDIKKMVLIK